MQLQVYHYTKYQYSESVFLDPHHLYFYPGHRSYLTLREFEIQLAPVSSGLTQRQDSENNLYHQCWFNEKMDQLEIEVRFVIDAEPINPFNFLIEAFPKTEHTEILNVFKNKEPLQPEVMHWLNSQYQQTGSDRLTFLQYLNMEIHERWSHEFNYQNTLIDPNDCFRLQNGSCRDLSWMMIQMLRNLDIPARFVSGYAYNADLKDGHELHAWVDAWIPGGGWVGFDPTAGILTTETYIPTATSYHPKNTLPVQGSFRGNASSELHTRVEITLR